MSPLIRPETGNWEHRLRQVIRTAINAGVVPTPTDINLAMSGTRSNVLNGRWTKVRTEMLEAAGYRLYVSPGSSTRWVAPQASPPDGWRIRP